MVAARPGIGTEWTEHQEGKSRQDREPYGSRKVREGVHGEATDLRLKL
jgi:hypothetical protein